MLKVLNNMNVGHVKKLLVPNQMRYQAALRPELLIYIGKPVHFNHYMRTKCNLNRHISGFLWGVIGEFKEIRTVITTWLISYHNLVWGVYGGFKIPRLTRVILNLVKQSTIKGNRKL